VRDAQECGVSMKHTSFQYLYRAGRDKIVEFWSHGGIDIYRKDASRFLAGIRPQFPNQMKPRTEIIILAIVVLIVACVGFDFYVWRLQHPQAPTWTFFFKGGK
jgi:hypothetical protein